MDLNFSNERDARFTAEKTRDVMWKDANADDWKSFWVSLCRVNSKIKKLQFHSDVVMMAKVVYKHKNQMRRDKSFQLFKKVVTLSKRLLGMDLFEDINTYQKIIGKFQRRNAIIGNTVEIPTKEFTEYIFQRNVGALQVIMDLLFYCQEAFKYLEGHMRLGFFIPFNLFAIASVSNVWSQSKFLQEKLENIHYLLMDLLQKIFNIDTTTYESSLVKLVGNGFIHDGSTRQAGNDSLNKKNVQDDETTMDLGAPLSPHSMAKLRVVDQSVISEDVNQHFSLNNKPVLMYQSPIRGSYTFPNEAGEFGIIDLLLRSNEDADATILKPSAVQDFSRDVTLVDKNTSRLEVSEEDEENDNELQNNTTLPCIVKTHGGNRKRKSAPSLNSRPMCYPFRRYFLQSDFRYLLKDQKSIAKLKPFINYSLRHSNSYQHTRLLLFFRKSVRKSSKLKRNCP